MKIKYHIIIFSLFLAATAFGQKSKYNQQKGHVAEGYDVVAYFDGKAIEGKENYSYTYDNAVYLFSTSGNLEKFKKEPVKYIPQYGGWCAYAVANGGKKVKINPKTYEVSDGKLYLFYNFGKTNTLEKWIKKGANSQQVKANQNWAKIEAKE